MAVKAHALIGNKQCARADLARIGDNARDISCRLAAHCQDPRQAGQELGKLHIALLRRIRHATAGNSAPDSRAQCRRVALPARNNAQAGPIAFPIGTAIAMHRHVSADDAIKLVPMHAMYFASHRPGTCW